MDGRTLVFFIRVTQVVVRLLVSQVILSLFRHRQTISHSQEHFLDPHNGSSFHCRRCQKDMNPIEAGFQVGKCRISDNLLDEDKLGEAVVGHLVQLLPRLDN